MRKACKLHRAITIQSLHHFYGNNIPPDEIFKIQRYPRIKDDDPFRIKPPWKQPIIGCALWMDA